MNSNTLIRVASVFLFLFFSSCLWIEICSAATFDTNGDGVEGIAEAIHALQVSAGKSPDNSKLIYVTAGGTSLENGQALLDALDEVNAGSENELHFIKLLPGIYDLGSRPALFTKPVSVQGFSRYATQITSTVNSTDQSTLSATIQCELFCEFRNMSILNTGSGSQAVAFYGVDGIHTEMENVYIDVNGSASRNIGIYSSHQNLVLKNSAVYVIGENETIGVYRLGSNSFEVSDTEISVYGTGLATAILAKYGHPTINSSIINASIKSGFEGTSIGLNNSDHCSARIENTKIGGSIGISNSAESNVTVKNSLLISSGLSIDSDQSSSIFAAYNQINGSVSKLSNNKCIGNYNIRYELLDAECQLK